MREGIQLVIDAGDLAGRVAKVDETHLILILEFSTAVAEVIASAEG